MMTNLTIIDFVNDLYFCIYIVKKDSVQ